MADSSKEDILDFFKKVVEGKAGISFGVFYKENESKLKGIFTQARLARLRFKSMDEVLKVLKEENISFIPNELAIRGENYLAAFDLDILDSNGRMSEKFRMGMFDGLLKKYKEKGDDAIIDLYAYIGYPKRINSKNSLEKIEDMESIAALECTFGDVEWGRFLLRAISKIERQFSDVDDVVLRAQESLKAFV